MGSHTTYRKRLLAVLVAIAGTAVVSGCAVPVSVQVASLVADGVSYAATEKTLTDHGLSAVTGQDCGIIKGFKRGKLCVAPDAPTDRGTVVAAAETNQTAEHETPPAPKPVTVQTPPATVNAPQSAPAGNTNQLTDANSRFYVIGSRFDYEDALTLADQYDALDPTIMVTSRDGKNQFDIVVGPFIDEQQASLRKRIVMSGIMNAWTRRIPLAQWRLERFGRS